MSPELLTGLSMAVLLLAAAAVVTRPWWRRHAGPAQDRRAANVAAYRLRLAELEAETASGLIPPDEAQNLRAELDARLLGDAGESVAELPSAEGRRPLAVAVVGVLLALFAVGGYVGSGSWRLQREIATAPGETQPPVDPQIAAMVDKLADKLKAQPDDAPAWSMLGRSYFVMHRYAEAAQAYAEANRRSTAPNAEWLTDESEALAFAGDREVSGRAAELIEQALALAPDDGKSLWYGGLASAQAGDFKTAKARWTKLLQAPDLPQSMRAALEERLKTIDDAEAGVPEDAPGATTMTAAAGSTGAARDAGLRVTVSLAPALAAKIPAGATLFVFAKAESGPQIPLAVQRLQDAKLPLDLTLDDSMAMAPTLRLSQFERYVITARFSASGGVQAQPGDLEGKVPATRAQAGGGAIALTIDHVVP